MIPMNFMKSKAGFTLVELIVVIAILGILAGIAVPAYSGYIKKANGAADTQTLAAANTALAASMTENLLAPSDAATYVKLVSDDANDGTAGCTVTLEAVTANNATAADIISDFAIYYGSSNIVFKYYDKLPATEGAATITTDGTMIISE